MLGVHGEPRTRGPCDGETNAAADEQVFGDDTHAVKELLQVNHISPQSEQFKDFIAKGDASEFAEMFVDWDKLWPEGVSSPVLPALLVQVAVFMRTWPSHDMGPLLT